MKKIVMTLAALAALSTTAFAAGNRSWDLRDAEYYTTSSTSGGVAATGITSSSVSSNALAISGGATGMSNFERLTRTSIENDQGRQ